jgi:hypothetical protein
MYDNDAILHILGDMCITLGQTIELLPPEQRTNACILVLTEFASFIGDFASSDFASFIGDWASSLSRPH